MGGANEKAIKTGDGETKGDNGATLLVVALTETCFGRMEAESAHDDKTDGIRNARYMR